MKKGIFTRFAAAALVLAAVACQNEDLLDGGAQNVELTPLTIKATLESGQSKTALQAGGKVYWENGDAMTVLAVGADAAVTSYKFTTADEGAEATFTGDVALAKDYYVVYPHTDTERFGYLIVDSKNTYPNSWKCNVADSKLKVYFPSMQKVSADGATGLDAYSVGVVAEDGTVEMKNLGGLIKINIPVEGIENVILYGNSDETIVGNAYVTFDENGLPVVSSVDGSNMVRIVPDSGTTFAVGEYYINVLPVTFSDGLSIIYTKSDDTWASVRSSGDFVVERSKISPLPTVSSLNFGGKVVDAIAVTDAGANNSKLFTVVPPSAAKSDTTPNNQGINFANQISPWTLKDTPYNINIYCSYAFYKTSGSGLCFGKSLGDYIEVPGIEGYALNKIVVRSSVVDKQCAYPQVQDVNGNPVPGGETWMGDKKPYGIEHVWSFSGLAGSPYRLVQTINNDYSQYHQIRLYYADAPEGVPAIKPLITSVTTAEPETDPYNKKATLKGSFAAIDFTLPAMTCGFEYKTVSSEQWTSVTCPQAATEFSYEFTADSTEDYVYRAWTKVNATDKVVYGEEVQFNARKLVLSLVFDDNYMTREDGYNFLRSEWKWGTNGNSTEENPNNTTYYYTYNDVDYPFTFWSYRPEPTVGGYALWVATQSKKVYGLSLSYTKNLADSQPAWMQMPCPAGYKLVEVNATLYNTFKGTISSSVNEDGTAAGDPVATFTGKSSFPLSLEGTEVGKRYYFCTTNNQQPTLKKLSLTYLYVGE